MAVLDPLKISIINYNENNEESVNFDINPQKPGQGKREILFSKNIYIEREDFQENPEEGFLGSHTRRGSKA